MKSKRDEGFTLIELLVVVSIISLLASVVLASLNSARAKARDAAIKTQLSDLRSAAEILYSTNGNYDALCNAGTNSGIMFTNAANQSNKVDNQSICSSSGGAILYTLSGAVVGGGKPGTPDAWGASVKLVNSSNYFCVDSTGIAREQPNIGVYFDGNGTTDVTCN